MVKKLNSKQSGKVLEIKRKLDKIHLLEYGSPVVKKKLVQHKRLYFDLETSYNVVSSWRIGYNINISHDNIIKERAIICICWKWEGNPKVYSLKWDNGCDKQLLIDFIEILNTADEVVSHNGDRFDLPWLRTRCIYHGIPMFPVYSSLDTLKLVKAGFNFNSKRLDYLGKFLGFGGKTDTGGFKLWQDIIENNCVKSMKLMVDYCKNDVILLEKVHQKLNPYTKAKHHLGVAIGNDKCSCPNCGSENLVIRGTRVTAAGTQKKTLQCKECFKFTDVLLSTWNKYQKEKNNQAQLV